MKPLALLALLLLGSATKAQTTAPAPGASSRALQQCLIATVIDTWLALKLSDDQLRRVELIQEACREECKPGGAAKNPKSISNADGDTVMTELQSILSDEQYNAWLAHCATLPATKPEAK